MKKNFTLHMISTLGVRLLLLNKVDFGGYGGGVGDGIVWVVGGRIDNPAPYQSGQFRGLEWK